MREWIKGVGRYLFGKEHERKPQHRPMMEPLEGRELLSVAMEPCGITVCYETEVTRVVNYHDVIHKYQGTIQTNLRPRAFKGMIDVQSINPATGRVTGRVSLPF